MCRRFVAICSDTDCDGTSYAAIAFNGEDGTDEEFDNEKPEWSSHKINEIMKLHEFLHGIYLKLDEFNKRYFFEANYTSIGFHESAALIEEKGGFIEPPEFGE